MIELQNVIKRYGKKANAFTALDDISLSIKAGASVAIIGKSGSGKSTLMHIISGLDHPDSGTVLIGGKDIFKLKQKAIDRFRAEKIGFIFQAFFIEANETCFQNVALPLEIAGVLRAERKHKVERALKQVELEEKMYEKAGNLSGGQKQRLAIARAIVNSPAIIFADEPTGNLDSATGDTIEKLLFSYNKKQHLTLIIVTHDPDLAKQCDIQLHIKDGRLEKITQKGKKS